MSHTHSSDAQDVNKPGEAVLFQAVELAKQIFGSRLISCYALGSLAHGGFCPLVSDVDIAIIINDPIVNDDLNNISRIQNQVKQTALALAERLSSFWGSPQSLQTNNSTLGRFPPLDKLDLLENGRLLFGKDIRDTLPKPSKADLVIMGTQFALEMLATPEMISEVRNPSLIIKKGVRALTKTVLFPVRLLYTAQTGKIGHNEEAVNYYLESGQNASSELVAAAYHWRYKEPNNQTEALSLLKESLINLYIEFINAYICMMVEYGEANLCQDLLAWKMLLNEQAVMPV